MISFIESVISQFGGRIAGSKEERDAQEFAKQTLASYCDEVEWHEFQAYLTSKFHALKGFCIVFVIGLILFKINVFVATIVALANSVLFFGHFVSYKGWLDYLYKKKGSVNVIGKIEPKGEVKSTLIISGHMDSVWEFQWWYKLGHIGGLLTTFSGALIALQGFIYLVASIFYLVNGSLPIAFVWIWLAQIILTPILVTFYSMHGSKKVDGAIDNLSGVAIAVEMAKVFGGENRLNNTRLKLISFGSEETGLMGSLEYVKDHVAELKQENAAVINVDTIRNKELLSIVTAEVLPMIKYPREMVEKMEVAFEKANTKYKKVRLPIGATDGASFSNQNIPAVSIVGLTVDKFDPNYHTRRDCLENLEPEGIEALRQVIIEFIKDWDK